MHLELSILEYIDCSILKNIEMKNLYFHSFNKIAISSKF